MLSCIIKRRIRYCRQWPVIYQKGKAGQFVTTAPALLQQLQHRLEQAINLLTPAQLYALQTMLVLCNRLTAKPDLESSVQVITLTVYVSAFLDGVLHKDMPQAPKIVLSLAKKEATSAND
jgi:hypothetical protein